MIAANRKSSWIAVAIAVAVVAAIIVPVVGLWSGIGDAGLSVGGWIAMALGILATLALGIGLMALVFISNRRGYDEPGNWR